jgi:hypothetical protein
MYGYHQARKLKNWWIYAVTRDARKLLVTAGCRRLPLNQKTLGRKTGAAGTENWASMPQHQ